MVVTYDLSFARKFAEIAEATVVGGIEDAQARRAVAYISRLSMELSLKSFLERVGMPVEEIKKHWHDLRKLIAEVDKCEVEIEISPNRKAWVPASRLRSVDITFLGHSATLGVIVQAEDYGASIYPNELRYGVMPRDFPAEAIAGAAAALATWVAEHYGAARRK